MGSVGAEQACQFEATVRKIQAQKLPFDEKAKMIQEARLKLNASYSRSVTSSNGQDDHASSSVEPRISCSHYQRRCNLKCTSCKKYYPCRFCHDDAEGHQFDRFATEVVQCTTCGAENQPATEPQCTQCGARYAKYHCKICRFFDDSGKKIFHCHKCGLCRLGEGPGIDVHHCDRCGACVPLESKDSHPCLEGALRGNCPVCTEDLASSRLQVVFMKCGHAAHLPCFNTYTKTKYTCPICFKSLSNMDTWFRTLDARIALEEPLPEPYRSRRCIIFCHDCEKRTTVPFHFTYMKCGISNCGSYNTRLISYAAETCSE